MAYSEREYETYLSEGIRYMREWDYEAAIKSFNESLKLNPSNSETYRLRGKSRLYGGSLAFMPYAMRYFKTAISDFEQAIYLDPVSPSAYLDRGMTHLWRGESRILRLLGKADYRKAIADFARAIELGRIDAQSFRLRGIAYVLLGEYKFAYLANADLNQSIAIDPWCASAYHWRSYALSQLDRESEALSDRYKAAELDPTLGTDSAWKLGMDVQIRYVGFEWPD